MAGPSTPPPPSPAPSTSTSTITSLDKPVERLSELRTEEDNDCAQILFDAFFCAGPTARIRQLYADGKMHNCFDDYGRLYRCLQGKVSPESRPAHEPQKHEVWQIRTRREAAAFWAQQYGDVLQQTPQTAAAAARQAAGHMNVQSASR